MRWRPDKPQEAELAHSIDGLAVWVKWAPKDGLRFIGQHFMRGERSPFGFDAEYEYVLRLSLTETAELARDLGLSAPRDLVAAIAATGPAVVQRGEQRWLRDHLGSDAGDLMTWVREL